MRKARKRRPPKGRPPLPPDRLGLRVMGVRPAVAAAAALITTVVVTIARWPHYPHLRVLLL